MSKLNVSLFHISTNHTLPLCHCGLPLHLPPIINFLFLVSSKKLRTKSFECLSNPKCHQGDPPNSPWTAEKPECGSPPAPISIASLFSLQKVRTLCGPLCVLSAGECCRGLWDVLHPDTLWPLAQLNYWCMTPPSAGPFLAQKMNPCTYRQLPSTSTLGARSTNSWGRKPRKQDKKNVAPTTLQTQ